jgi:hypothetical protein
MAITAHIVEPAYVNATWPLAEKYIKDALDSADLAGVPKEHHLYTLEHVQAYVASGNWQLLIALEDGQVLGAAVVSYINYPLHRVAYIVAIGGRLITNKDTFTQLKSILKGCGATLLQGHGRPAIVRLWKRFNLVPGLTSTETLL